MNKDITEEIELQAQDLNQIHCDIDRGIDKNDRQYYLFLKKALTSLTSLAITKTKEEMREIIKGWKNEGENPTETDLVLENILTKLK